MNEFNEKGNTLIEYLKKKADGKTEITLLKEFNHVTLDIIASVIVISKNLLNQM